MAVQWFRHRETGVEVAAVRFAGHSGDLDEIERFAGGDCQDHGHALVVATPQGGVWLGMSGWLVRDSDGDFCSRPKGAFPEARWERFEPGDGMQLWPPVRS